MTPLLRVPITGVGVTQTLALEVPIEFLHPCSYAAATLKKSCSWPVLRVRACKENLVNLRVIVGSYMPTTFTAIQSGTKVAPGKRASGKGNANYMSHNPNLEMPSRSYTP